MIEHIQQVLYNIIPGYMLYSYNIDIRDKTHTKIT